MSIVYPAEDLGYRRKMAGEVLRPALAAVPWAARFLAEVGVTAGRGKERRVS